MGFPALVPDLARPEDDAELRRLLRENAMPGAIATAFEREPTFFGASRIEGVTQQVLVYRDRDAPERLLGFACRSTRPMWVNGEIEEVGYLSGLRFDPAIRTSTALARGWQVLRGLHEADGRVRLYVSTILEGNRAAIGLLTSGRAGLPVYRDLGRLRTHAVVPFGRRRGPVAGVTVVRGSPGLLPAIASCLARSGTRRQFAPALGVEDLAPGASITTGLAPEDWYVARRAEAVVGVLARWDQRALKQTVVVSYGGWMRIARPLHACLARLGGFAPLPAPGEHFPYVYAAWLAVDGDDLDVARALVHALHDDVLGAGLSFFMLGLHERDPLVPVVQRFRSIPYDARLYAVHWPDGADAYGALDGRVPRPEIAVL